MKKDSENAIFLRYRDPKSQTFSPSGQPWCHQGTHLAHDVIDIDVRFYDLMRVKRAPPEKFSSRAPPVLTVCFEPSVW